MKAAPLWDRIPLAAVGLLWAAIVLGGLGYTWWSALWSLAADPAAMPASPIWVWAALVATGGPMAWAVARSAQAALGYRRRELDRRQRLAHALEPMTALVGAPCQRLQHCDTPELAAFPWGFWRPEIVIADALWNRLGPAERSAVLYHELSHVRRRDPAQHAILQVLAAGFGWAGLAKLFHYYLVQRELIADDLAIAAAGGQKAPLVRALLATVAAGGAPLAPAPVGLGGVWTCRLAHLDTAAWPHQEARVMGRRLLMTTLSATVLVAQSLLFLCH